MTTTFISTDNLYSEWDYAKSRNYTRLSLLKVMKGFAARRRAFVALQAAYSRLACLPRNWNATIFDADYDPQLVELCIPVFDAIQAISDETAAFLPVYEVEHYKAEISRNYSAKIDYFPLSRWHKDARAALKHAQLLSAAIDKVVDAAREEGYLA